MTAVSCRVWGTEYAGIMTGMYKEKYERFSLFMAGLGVWRLG